MGSSTATRSTRTAQRSRPDRVTADTHLADAVYDPIVTVVRRYAAAVAGAALVVGLVVWLVARTTGGPLAEGAGMDLGGTLVGFTLIPGFTLRYHSGWHRYAAHFYQSVRLCVSVARCA